MILSSKALFLGLAALPFVASSLQAQTIQLATPIGGSKTDIIHGVALLPEGKIAIGGLFGATKPNPKKDDTEGGSGNVMVLDKSGKTTATLSLPTAVNDLDANHEGTIFFTGEFGTGAVKADLKTSVFTSKAGGKNAHVTPASEGGCVVLNYDGTVTCLNAMGEQTSSFRVKGQHPEDLTCDPKTGSIFIAGFDNKSGTPPGQKKYPVQIAWLECYKPNGELLWRSFGWGGQQVADLGLMADTRIYRLAFGADEKLYVAGESAGGNSMWSRKSHDLETKADLVTGDHFQHAYGTGANHITAVLRLDPATGETEKVTFLLARIDSKPNGKGNTIRPRSIAADASGNVFIGGACASNAPFSEGAFGQQNCGGSYFIVLNKDFNRTYATVLGSGITRGIAVRDGLVALVGDEKATLSTHLPIKAESDPNGDGWLALFQW